MESRLTLPDYVYPDEGIFQVEGSVISSSGKERFDFSKESNSVYILNSWFSGENLIFKFLISFDVEKVSSQCGLTQGTKFAASVLATSDTTKVRLASPAALLEDSVNGMEFELDSKAMGGQIKVELVISVADLGAGVTSDLAPPKYSSLFTRSYNIAVEGGASRASVEQLDFENTITPKALWLIDTSFPDGIHEWLEADINNCISVAINAFFEDQFQLPAFQFSLASEYQFVILEHLAKEPELFRNLVKLTITPGYEYGSLFGAFRSAFSSIFPLGHPDEAIELIRVKPNHVRAMLQSSVVQLLGMK